MLRGKIGDLLGLFRPELTLSGGICVITSQILASGRFPPLTEGILGFISVFCLSGSALILNNYFDYEVDKVNHGLYGDIKKSKAPSM